MTKLELMSNEVFLDLETPVSVYLKLEEDFSFLLESVSGSESVARFSYIGFDPMAEVKSDGQVVSVIIDNIETTYNQPLLTVLESVIQSYQLTDSAVEFGFSGGAAGFFSFETFYEMEPEVTKTDAPHSSFPQSHFILPRSIVAFDHTKRSVHIGTLHSGDIAGAKKRLKDIEDKIKTPLSLSHSRVELSSEIPDNIFDSVETNMSKEMFLKAVNQAKSHIFEGDVFQLVLSQQFKINSNRDPFDVYRRLRQINPSPYMYFFRFPSYQIIGASPEILVKLSHGEAMVRPIAGTRHRHKGAEADLTAELLADPKERAEHLMLVDLGRNDLGRVCQIDSIQADELMTIETYSHVIHIVSTVTGKLMAEKSAFDLLKATFPAGTLSGAPKIKAMELIAKLEPIQRGPYGGALGLIDFKGNMDLCIVIRTALAQNGTYTVQAGAGIVADSDPEAEYEETKSKAQGVLTACWSHPC